MKGHTSTRARSRGLAERRNKQERNEIEKEWNRKKKMTPSKCTSGEADYRGERKELKKREKKEQR